MASAHPENKIGPGTLLVGKYRVTRELGRGGMAAVYEAEHINIGKRVAVKVLAAELANSAIVIERFIREARAAASVKSPYIVEVYDSGRLEDGRPFIAMELLEGESLYDRMARVRLIDPATTVRIIGQVAKGLTKAHAIGIVHRDLKPENIHLCKGEDGEEIAKILDFGLAKFYSPVKTDEKTARLTREGAVFGTPAYMSPEQVKGQGSVDHRADLWALGCMAYECLTGRPVWNTEQGVAMTFAAIATSPLPLPSRFRPDSAARVRRLVQARARAQRGRALPDGEGARRRAGPGARHTAHLPGEHGPAQPDRARRHRRLAGSAAGRGHAHVAARLRDQVREDGRGRGERAARSAHPELAEPQRHRHLPGENVRAAAALVASTQEGIRAPAASSSGSRSSAASGREAGSGT